MTRRGRRSSRLRPLPLLGLLLLTVFCLLPLAWMLSTSLKPLEETFVSPPQWLPEHPTLAAYGRAWSIQSFGTYFANTAIVTMVTTVLAVTIGSLAGYGFSRFRFRGRAALMGFTLSTQMFPGVLLVIPYFAMASRLGLFNTHLALIIAYTSFALPFCIWMLKGFFDRVPRELDEAAMLDGASRLTTFWKVLLPLTLPAQATLGVFTFLGSWNDYWWPLISATRSDMYTLTVGLASSQMNYAQTSGLGFLMAQAVFASIPIFIVYIVFQKQIVRAMAGTAVR